MNNPALYDAVIAGITLSNNSWPLSSNPTDYNQLALAAVAIATEVDDQIPTITNGATISQRNLMGSIVKSIFSNRYQVDTDPNKYLEIAQVIVAIFTTFSTKLVSHTTGVNQSGKILYLTSIAEGIIADYNQLVQESSYVTAAEVTIPLDLAPNTTVYSPTSFISSAIGLPIIQQGEWLFDIYAEVNNNNGSVTFTIEIYSRTVTDVETLLFSATSPIISNSGITLFTLEDTESMIDIDPTDRIVVKLKGTKTGGGNHTILTLYYDGTIHASHIHTTLPVA